MLALGLMSGTSLDGVDAALLDTDGVTIATTFACATLPYPAPLRARLRALLDRAAHLPPDDPELRAAERALTEHHAAAIARLAGSERAVLIGLHGQTILHRPAERRTWQIGDAPLLARLAGRRVAYDFRSADVAAGGQGAPLAPLMHAAITAGRPRPLAVLNIGGVANLSWIGPDGGMLACDTGPGNALLDDWAQRHTGAPLDRDGALAAAGRPHAPTLARLLDHPFFARPAPKSLDRQDFAHALDAIAPLSPEDGAATLAAFTAAAVAATLLPAPPREWLVTGGGRHNPAIMAALARRLAAPVRPVEAAGADGDALEAQCFALLAVRVLRGLPITFPSTTGAPRPLAGGRIADPP